MSLAVVFRGAFSSCDGPDDRIVARLAPRVFVRGFGLECPNPG
jgi:hypothetical protein